MGGGTPGPGNILPDNRKDAYLVRAIELLFPTHLLTLDDGLLGLGSHGGARIMTPKAMLNLLETNPRI
ncbi:MAG TPA: hypothetical protein VM142_01950 [Acidimicrobiales bacterium]|nr:hypothetical protein [Acidimicrobiales bacterium]